MNNWLKILMMSVIMIAISSANPIQEPFIQEISVCPLWIEVQCWRDSELIGRTITTREGSAEILSAYPGPNGIAVLDSSNTTGFYLNPEGDSITIALEYLRFCDCIGYGIFGESAGAPLPGNSIQADFYFHGDGDFPPQYWFFSFCLEPTPGEYREIDWYDEPSWGTSSLIISELSLNSNWRDHPGFIELYNAGDEPIGTESYCLISGAAYYLPNDQFVYPRQFYIVDENICPELFALNSNDVVYLTRRDGWDNYAVVDQVGWDIQLTANTSFMRFPDGDVDWENWDDFLGYTTETSYTFENGFPTRGAANRHDCPGFVVIGTRADSIGEGEARIGWTDPIWDDQFDYSVLVSNDSHYPESLDDGEVIYQGSDQEFADLSIPPVGRVYYTVFAHNIIGDYSTPTSESQACILFNSAGIGDESLPLQISYFNCYPNPFNAQTTISFSLVKSGNVEIAIYDLTGRLVETVANGYYSTGGHSVIWDAGNFGSGVYFARLQAEGSIQNTKLALLK